MTLEVSGFRVLGWPCTFNPGNEGFRLSVLRFALEPLLLTSSLNHCACGFGGPETRNPKTKIETISFQTFSVLRNTVPL